MSNNKDIEQKIIEGYYRGRENNIGFDSVAHDNSADIFEEKLKLSMNKMDMLDEADFELDIDIMGIIVTGEEIKDRRKEKKEFLGFIGLASILMAVLVLLCFFINPKIFVYWQIAVYTLIPLSLIPLALVAKNREEV